VAERVQAGKVSPVEEVKARVALSVRLIEKGRAEGELAAARKVLTAAWGGTEPTFSAAQGDLERSPEVPSFEALSERMADNPEMARWLVEIERGRASLETERAGRFPDVRLRGGVRYISPTDDWAFVAGLSIPIPVFNRNQGATLEAQYRLAKTEEQRRALHVRVQAALASTYQRLSSARNEAISLKNDVLPGARSALRRPARAFGKASSATWMCWMPSGPSSRHRLGTRRPWRSCRRRLPTQRACWVSRWIRSRTPPEGIREEK
jgi:cobalt-zinc-cadmium efflux system outer membrane protein